MRANELRRGRVDDALRGLSTRREGGKLVEEGERRWMFIYLDLWEFTMRVSGG